MRFLLGVALAILLAACGGKAEKDVTVMVAEGSSLTAAAKMLEEKGAIKSASAFSPQGQAAGFG